MLSVKPPSQLITESRFLFITKQFPSIVHWLFEKATTAEETITTSSHTFYVTRWFRPRTPVSTDFLLVNEQGQTQGGSYAYTHNLVPRTYQNTLFVLNVDTHVVRAPIRYKYCVRHCAQDKSKCIYHSFQFVHLQKSISVHEKRKKKYFEK